MSILGLVGFLCLSGISEETATEHSDSRHDASSDLQEGPIHARDPTTRITHTALCGKLLLPRARILREESVLFYFFLFISLWN